MSHPCRRPTRSPARHAARHPVRHPVRLPVRLPVRRAVGHAVAVAALALAVGTAVHAAEPSHGISIFGDLKYGPDFEHFDYASPDAVKGGNVTLAAIGSFDNLNPFILKGQAPVAAGAIYDTLIVNSRDEPFSVYGALAESIEVPEDKRWVTFRLRREARWHDGVALTADDVVWTFDTIKEKGHPLYKTYYAAAVKAEALDPHTVKFSFSEGNNAELPLIMGQLPILPKHYWEEREFGATTLEPPLGSGAYRISAVDPGRSITLELVEDYWGRDIPVNVGRDNFGTMRYDYYRDSTVALEALKAGDIDFRRENTAKSWATAYDFPAVAEGRVVLEEIPDDSTQTMQGFVMNLRKPKFQDQRVRRALNWTFDFEWMNENLFYGAYERTHSYFQNSEMQATGLPEGRELEILEELRGEVPESVFTEEFTLPKTDGSGRMRQNYREALKLFREAGLEVKDGELVEVESGEAFTIDMMLASPAMERVGLAWAKNLERVGIDARVRTVDSAQYEKRVEDFDFDVVVGAWRQSASPGNEQVDYWGSATANEPGARNLMGIANPAIDALIERIISAGSREELVASARALDRVLLHNDYLIPQWYGPSYRLAYADKFARPDTRPDSILGFEFWWIDPDKAAALKN